MSRITRANLNPSPTRAKIQRLFLSKNKHLIAILSIYPYLKLLKQDDMINSSSMSTTFLSYQNCRRVFVTVLNFF